MKTPTQAFLAGIAVTIVLVLALGGAYMLGRGGGDDSAGTGAKAEAEAATAVSPIPTPPRATATAVPPPQPTPVPQPVVLPDRTSCADIRGTDYRSETERLWFIANCPPAISVPMTECPAIPGLGTYFVSTLTDLARFDVRPTIHPLVWEANTSYEGTRRITVPTYWLIKGPNGCFRTVIDPRDTSIKAVCADGYLSTDATDLKCVTHGGVWYDFHR